MFVFKVVYINLKKYFIMNIYLKNSKKKVICLQNFGSKTTLFSDVYYENSK